MISENTKQKIISVAETCIRCRRCMKECLMLGRFAENPKALFTQYLEKGPENMDRHIAYSCNECSQCTLKCPKGLNLKAVFQSLKEDYAEENQGLVPVAALLPSEEGQKKECAPEYCTLLRAGDGGRHTGGARYVFVPGEFPPESIVDHLRDSLGKNNVELLPCTGETQPGEDLLLALRDRQDSTVITACPSSYQALTQALPDRRILFYWDLMQELIGLPQTSLTEAKGRELMLHGTDQVSTSIRWVLEKLSCQVPQDQSAPSLQTADQDCRQILGLLFGNTEIKEPAGT